MSYNMTRTEVAIIIALIVGIGAGYFLRTQTAAAPKPAAAVHVPTPQESTASEKSQLEYVNDIRAQHGLAALTEDPALDASAKAKGDDMVALHYYTHDRPNGDPFYNVIYKNDPGLHRVGENLAECNQTIAKTYEKYVASPEHLANILNPNYTLFGSYITWDTQTLCAIDVNHFGSYQ